MRFYDVLSNYFLAHMGVKKESPSLEGLEIKAFGFPKVH